MFLEMIKRNVIWKCFENSEVFASGKGEYIVHKSFHFKYSAIVYWPQYLLRDWNKALFLSQICTLNTIYSLRAIDGFNVSLNPYYIWSLYKNQVAKDCWLQIYLLKNIVRYN